MMPTIPSAVLSPAGQRPKTIWIRCKQSCEKAAKTLFLSLCLAFESQYMTNKFRFRHKNVPFLCLKRCVVYTPALTNSPKSPPPTPPRGRDGQTPVQGSKFKIQGSRGVGIVYTPLLLYSYTPSERLLSTLLTKDYCPNSYTPKRAGNMILSCNYYSFLCRNRKKYGKKSKKYYIFLSEYSIFANWKKV